MVFEDAIKDNSISEIMNDDYCLEDDDAKFTSPKFPHKNLFQVSGRKQQHEQYQSQEPSVKKLLVRPQTANVMFRNNS